MRIEVVGISDLIDSNIFLRALWSELRSRFGKCAWNYQPDKDGPSRTIFLGWADINQERTVSISLSYSQKSVVNGIYFGEQFDEFIDESSELGQQLKAAVDTALQRRHEPRIRNLRIPISSLYRAIAPYSSDSFKISPHQHNISLIDIKIKAFDDEDPQTEALRVASYILDILSVETNSPFWLFNIKSNQENISEMESEETIDPEVNTFVTDEEWMDDIPIHNGCLLVSSQAIRFIDRILSKNKLGDAEERFIRSCHHYHVAREQDALIHDIVFSGEQENEDGSVSLLLERNSRIITASMFSK